MFVTTWQNDCEDGHVIKGGVTSSVHVAVLCAVEVLPQPSIAVNLLICVRVQLLLAIGPSRNVTVGVLQASVAVAVPKTASIEVSDGLQFNGTALPVAVMTGGVLSKVHVIILDAVEVFPHTSLAVHVLVCERPHPVL